ncbi:MAG: hypothetical protein F2893_00200, partial [Actinobacteria bacterium]|nr:hypothetical protein [Actinomycetota bacterium]
MKRGVLILLVLCLISPINVSAGAVVKAGAVCTKLNTTTTVSGYKYTCIKGGKKYIWSKGIKVA